jgi:hypothetical protein
MTLSRLWPRALLFALGCGSVFGAIGDPGSLVPEVTRPHSERVDRAWKRYRNPDLGYCVSYPSRWERAYAFNGSGLVVETGLHRNSKPSGEIDFGPLDSQGPEDARLAPASLTPSSLDDDLLEHLAGMRKFARAEKMEVLAQHPLKLQGYTALYAKSKYYDPLERSNWVEEIVFVTRKGELFRIELQCPPDQINRFEPVFAYLVNTFDLDCTK